MPTVIDSLVVTLGLDASKFTEQQKKAVDSLRQFQDAADKSTKPVQKGMDDLVGTFKEFQGRLLAIGALIATGLGFNRLVQDVTKLNTELGFTSKTLGITAQQLSEWEQIGRTVGASSGEITQNLKSLNAEIQEFHATGSSKLGAFMGQAGIKPLQPNDTPDAVAKRLSEWYQGQGNKAYASHLLQSRGGLSQGMINLLSLGPEEIQKRLDQAKRFAPTDEEIKKFTRLTEAFGEMLNVIDRLATKAILPFVDALTKILKMLTDWLGKWAENNQTPAEVAGDGLSKMGLPELKQDAKKPSLIQRGWNWLRGNPSGGAAEGTGRGGGGANDNTPGGAAARPAGPGASPDSAQPTGGAARPAPPGSAGPGSPGASPDSAQQPAAGAPAAGARLAPNGQAPAAFIMHHTGDRHSPEQTAAIWARERPGVGTQYIMDREGVVHDVEREYGYRGHGHFLHSRIPGVSNNTAVGMEITAKNDADMTERQKAAAIDFAQRHYPNTPVYGHSEVSPGDRTNEGVNVASAVRELRARQGNSSPAGPSPGTQRSFENWRNLGLGARGATLGPQSSISNSQSNSTHIASMNVSSASGGDHSGSGDIQRRLGDYDNVQNSNTGMV